MQNPSSAVDYSHDLLVRLKSQADKATYEKLSHATTVLTKARSDAKWTKNPRTIYELALIKITKPELDSSEEALIDRIAEVEEKTKNPIVITKEVSVEEKDEPEEQVKKKPEISARLFAPIDKNALTSSSPIVVTARGWDRIASSICNRYPFLGGIILNRKITIDAEGILILFNKNETTLKKLASNYIETIQSEFARQSKTDFGVKIAFSEDVEDVMIDYWNLPSDGKEKNTPISDDPLDNIGMNFSEIVEYKDDDKGEINPNADLAQQQEIFKEESEEFLSDEELSENDNIDN